jgi:hypothetical protein
MSNKIPRRVVGKQRSLPKEDGVWEIEVDNGP